MNIFNHILEDIEIKKEVNSSELKTLTSFLSEAERIASLIEVKQEECKELEKNHNKIMSQLIPDLFDSIGLKQLKLSDGSVVTVSTKFVGTITKENQEKCFDYLRETNNDGIIKNDITIPCGKQQELADEIVETLEDENIEYNMKSYVHPQTLNAFIKEQIENGVDFPTELFSVFPVRNTKVQKSK
jgi:hypothetical protein